MKIVVINLGEKISMDALRHLGEEFYKDLVVGAVDLRQEIVAFGGQFNNDARNFLVDKHGSRMEDVWGFKIVLAGEAPFGLEDVALTDIRPGEGNPAERPRKNMRDIIRQLVESRIEQNAVL